MNLAVVGGGVIGLTCALRAADAGWRVTVFDAGVSRRASDVAAGMLGSLGEGHPGEEALLELSAASVRLWPELLRRLDDPDIVAARDSLFVAFTAADMKYLHQLARFVWSSDDEVASRLTEVSATQVRAKEPMLSGRLQGGYQARGEMAVDNRRLLSALRRALADVGVEFIDARVTDLADVRADRILLAAGVDAARLWPGLRIYEAKGEVLRLGRTRWSVAPPRHVIRGRIDNRNVYLVPRGDGVVVGATQYESADPDDRTPQVGGVADLLSDACEIMPGLRTYDLTEVGAGLRPMTDDGVPVVERVDDRVVVAAGHGRNGILLAPHTADRVAELLTS
ncbi:thiamine biosynthesis oxidoreductase ThiO [Gordonia effusa NBRC 100432]|uniref:glycine oxidase n=1 Tax=Gordonia effusa NBRC 100432 TaxID=1077974 RepID=H0QXT3_9ACTN|nr:glycine oxidase ThiO [Gordonia effusa]GAB17634.1 thiamine biosynthesis oxidoreductase ThiO [Gordonia effusa NBRC 100432]